MPITGGNVARGRSPATPTFAHDIVAGLCYFSVQLRDERYEGVATQMQVRQGMSNVVLTVGPEHSLRDAAALMTERRVGAAVVNDPDGAGPSIITERDVLVSIAAGEDPDAERVGSHLTSDVVYAAPNWSLEEAAAAMVRGQFRHLIVVDGGSVCGLLSMRDIVRCWTEDGSICEVPDGARFLRTA
jgi:CBS domain-containing protein